MKQSEIWRPIQGYEGIYEVSDLGRIRRSPDSKPTSRSGPGYVLKNVLNGHGYPNITLCRDGEQRSYGVHQLVCRAFHGPPPFERAEVAHGDGDRRNPRASNLRWATHAENGIDMQWHRACRPFKLVKEEVLEIRRRYQKGNRRELAEEFRVSATTISAIVTRKTFKYLR